MVFCLTTRSFHQTATIALRLERGDKIYEDANLSSSAAGSASPVESDSVPDFPNHPLGGAPEPQVIGHNLKCFRSADQKYTLGAKSSSFSRTIVKDAMDHRTLLNNVGDLSAEFARRRSERQLRRSLDAGDFDKLARAGLPLVGVPIDEGGLWQNVETSTRPICEVLRTLAQGDSSIALVSAMHPAVLSYWLTVRNEAAEDDAWQSQCRQIFQSVREGSWWGTMTSEPGTGGDVGRTRTIARPTGSPHQYLLSGQKHFGSGSGMMSSMVTTAVTEGDDQPDWFFLDLRDVPWDGSRGVKLVFEWDGHGMTATQSHAMVFERFPATRIAWPGHLPTIVARTGSFIGCLFTSVIVGILDVALETAYLQIDSGDQRAFEQVEWARAKTEGWLVQQAFEGMQRAVEQQDDPRLDVLHGKTAIAELSESILTRLCRVIGGGTYARRSPFGFWFEDVRALGFLRPPWGLAQQSLIDGFSSAAE